MVTESQLLQAFPVGGGGVGGVVLVVVFVFGGGGEKGERIFNKLYSYQKN